MILAQNATGMNRCKILDGLVADINLQAKGRTWAPHKAFFTV